MTKAKVPCSKDCPDRTVEPNCHMSCPKYLGYQEQRRKELETMFNLRQQRYEADGFAVEVKKRNKMYQLEKWQDKRRR